MKHLTNWEGMRAELQLREVFRNTEPAVYRELPSPTKPLTPPARVAHIGKSESIRFAPGAVVAHRLSHWQRIKRTARALLAYLSSPTA